ncbi:MAG TPA: hypothetical protein VFT59_03430 [Candidatus Saccharimonadales bacterium]|nr:hypothetical protein [Candidatus Saccharimonadales bacterium]
MSAERINQSPEIKRSPESHEAGHEHHERLREQRERAGEKSREKLEDVTHEALEQARSAEVEKRPAEQERQPSPAERRGVPSRLEQDTTFENTMSEVRSQMSAPSRTFSKIIHNKAVEKVSEATGNTIARPNAILSGAVFAFALTLAVYLVAKNLGYPLSGFESIAAFVLGWALGIVYDFLKVMVTGRQ